MAVHRHLALGHRQAGQTLAFKGPFNYLRSCGTLKERYRDKWRSDGLPWLDGRLAGETFRKTAIGKGHANVKEQLRPMFRPAHLLLLTIRLATSLLTLASAAVEAIRFPSQFLAPWLAIEPRFCSMQVRKFNRPPPSAMIAELPCSSAFRSWNRRPIRSIALSA